MRAERLLHLPNNWTKALLALLCVLIASITVFFDTWSIIVETWSRTKTYTHGFVIAPVSFWLIWSRRHYYLNLYPTPSHWALVGVVLSGFVWLAGDLSHILIIKQLAVVAMMISGFWFVLGTSIALSMMFPLLFLFFMVPMGEELIPSLIEFTTTFTVNMIRLTGLPVYREGSNFTLTSGNWSVIEACSGISYLIASITLGFVFAYLNYALFWKRLLFMVLSCVVPIIANGFRAYMIVMIGHFSDMTLAVGVDHLIYGGLFFGLVMLLMFYLGSFWRDPPFTPIAIVITEPVKNKGIFGLLSIAILLIFLSVWPMSSAWLMEKQSANKLPESLVNSQLTGWKLVEDPHWLWTPYFDRAIGQSLSYYADGKHIIGIYHTSFGKEEQGAELVNSENILISGPERKRFYRVIFGTHSLQLANNGELLANSMLIKETDKQLMAMDWYQIDGTITANRYLVKWLQLIKRLTGDLSPEMKVVIWTEISNDDKALPKEVLKNFLVDWVKQHNLTSSG